MVVALLGSRGDGGDPLCRQGASVGDEGSGIAGAGADGVAGVEETDRVGALGAPRGVAVGGGPSALGSGGAGLGAAAGKVAGLTVPVCPSDGLASGRIGASLIQILQ